MRPEFFDVVDEDDRVIGRELGKECVRRGLLHRAIVILLFDEHGGLYIQKRADSMSWYPGHWTLSVMGHVRSGETYEEAAKRELSEELDVDCELTRVAKVKTPDWPYGELVEREYLTVFEGRAMKPKITLSEETKEGRFVGLDDFERMVEGEPEALTPDTLLAFDVYRRSAP